LLSTSGIITNSAQINNGVVANAQIGNAAISTAKIGNNMVTFPTASVGTSGVDITLSSGNVTTTTLTVNASGAPAQIIGGVGITHLTGTGTNSAQFIKFNINLYDNGSVVRGYSGAYVGHINMVHYNLPYIPSYLVGSHTYTLRIQVVSGGTATTLRYFAPTITYLELKR